MRRAIFGVFVLVFVSCGRFKPPSMSPEYSSELLYWCMQPGEWPVYEKSPQHCASISRGRWSRIPITLNAEVSLIPEALVAIDSFNSQVGFELFKFEISNPDPDVAIVTAGPHWGIAMRAVRMTYKGVPKGGILVHNGIENKDRADILVHELGHLVGLKHDSADSDSIMFPTAAQRTARLQRIDIQTIRALYGIK